MALSQPDMFYREIPLRERISPGKAQALRHLFLNGKVLNPS